MRAVTSVYRISSIRNTDAKFYIEKTQQWTNDPINILSVIVHQENEDLLHLNYGPVINKIEVIHANWGKSNLSLFGRKMIVNSLAASLFVYKMSVL